MNGLEEAKRLVEAMSDRDIAHFAHWFCEYHNDRWDREIEEDSKAGRFDELIKQAIEDDDEGRSTPL